MAKENTVYLYGRVKQPPRIYKNKAGQYVLGKIVVDTNRKSYATEELLLRGEIRRDTKTIITQLVFIYKGDQSTFPENIPVTLIINEQYYSINLKCCTQSNHVTINVNGE